MPRKVQKKLGRPFGSKNKPKTTTSTTTSSTRRPGRAARKSPTAIRLFDNRSRRSNMAFEQGAAEVFARLASTIFDTVSSIDSHIDELTSRVNRLEATR